MYWTPAAAVEQLRQSGAAVAVFLVREQGSVEQVTAVELAARVAQASGALNKRGIKKGNVVALHAANSVEWIATALACGWIGAPLAPIDSLIHVDAAREMASQLNARLLVTDRPSTLQGAQNVGIADIFAQTAGQTVPAAALKPDDPIAIFRTSGTTGTPKVFSLSRKNIGFNVTETAAGGLVKPGDRVLMPLPMHHVFPWIVGTLVPLWEGASVVLPAGMTGPQISAAMKLAQPTVLVGVPKLFDAVLTAIRGKIGGIGRNVLDFIANLQSRTGLPIGPLVFFPLRRAVAPSLRLLVSGGAKLREESRTQLEALGWDIRSGYGLSETAAIFTGELRRKRPGTEGQPLTDCHVRIENQGPDGTGEILVKGPNVFAGYIDNPEENSRAFDADGYFRSGDLGRLDPDGFLCVTGRSKEIIVLGAGENIYPEDLERSYEAEEDIAEIAVLDHKGSLAALVVPNMAVIARRGSVDPDQGVRVALSTVARNLPSHHRIAEFRILKEPLPRTRLGKIRRFMLPEIYETAVSGALRKAQPLSAEDVAWLQGEPRRSVWGLLSEGHEAGSVGLESSVALDLGFDSFAWMNLALRIEEATGVRLQAGDIAAISSVRDLMETVSRLQEERQADQTDEGTSLLADAKARWLTPQSPAERLAGLLTMLLIRVVMRSLFRLSVRGLENVPRDGPALICPNHVSYLDPLMVSSAFHIQVHRRAVWAADAITVFQSPVYRWFCRPLMVFPADKRVPDVTIGLALEALGEGRLQVWFPEGWRSGDGVLLPFQPGIGKLIRESGAPVVPTVIKGALEAWPRDRRLPRLFKQVEITFCQPVDADDLIASTGKSDPSDSEVASALFERFRPLVEWDGQRNERTPHVT
ncbi:AMP-binding protein [Ovoidimarina sediminis]|uniref:AMP-binding protein n=1 Tax=Ovoidimarina sediminis TaxID=3079856 RepID=UPI00290A863A|nr:AMP-binding protein [Rhodophyticola sp. MJ-SS7]MDU8946675.1 AMP-binding protein [Rhodophyticola sp. MJ-SS7]